MASPLIFIERPRELVGEVRFQKQDRIGQAFGTSLGILAFWDGDIIGGRQLGLWRAASRCLRRFTRCSFFFLFGAAIRYCWHWRAIQ